MVSERKLIANRRNASLSTGPKDTRKTRHNALKHGLLSTAAIIRRGDAKEDPRELEAIVEALREDFNPVGAMEEILVERIAVCYWRLRRAQRAEVGEIRQAADNAELDVMLATADRCHQTMRFERMGLHAAEEGSQREMLMTSFGTEHLGEILKQTRALIEEQGFLTQDQLRELAKVYGLRDGTLGYWLSFFSSMATDGPERKAQEPEKWHDIPSPDKCKEILLSFINEEAEKLKVAATVAGDREELEREATALSLHLPKAESLEKILRYETAIERQMYRAIKELRALQAARMGDGTVKRRMIIGMEEEA